MSMNVCASEDTYMCHKSYFLSCKKKIHGGTDTLAGCLAPANGTAPSFMRVRREQLFAWFVGTTTAARRVLLLCLSGLAEALPAKPQHFFEVFPNKGIDNLTQFFFVL